MKINTTMPPKPTPADGHIHLRVPIERKNLYVKSAQRRAQGLSKWMLDAADFAAIRQAGGKLLAVAAILTGLSAGAATITDDQIARAVIGEAGGESLQTQTAVAESIRARVARYGDLRGVYGYKNPVVAKATPATWTKARQAVADSKTSHLLPPWTLYFGGDRLDDHYFRTYKRVAHYGHVSFYQPK
jgi:hypothetical protein